jgi:integrase
MLTDTAIKGAKRREKPYKLFDELRQQLASGVDPSAKRNAEKIAGADTFEALAREWFAKFSTNWAKTHSDKIIRRLESDIFPWLGSKPVGQVTAPELLTCLRRVESRGALDTAHRAHQNCAQIFRYAMRPAERSGIRLPTFAERCHL